MIFLQNTVPYISWNNPINDDNVHEAIKTHKDTLINEYIDWEKIILGPK
jgi:hypothetical protein